MDLHAARQTGGMGPSAIGFPDIGAWAALTGTAPRRWEVLALREIDVAWMEEWTASRPKPAPGKGRKPASRSAAG